MYISQDRSKVKIIHDICSVNFYTWLIHNTCSTTIILFMGCLNVPGPIIS